MDDMTPSSDDSGDTNDADNWQGRYAGLQKVLAKRDSELSTANASLDQLRKESEQALADLDTYRQRDVDTSEEDLARQQFEALRTRFEAPAPTPIGNNAARDWTDSQSERYGDRERTGTSQGFPV